MPPGVVPLGALSLSVVEPRCCIAPSGAGFTVLPLRLPAWFADPTVPDAEPALPCGVVVELPCCIF